MVEFVQRNGRRWQITDDDPVEAATTIERVAAGELGEAELAEWIRARAR
jgi:prophage maintenance system killer protein